ncbi:MAG: hypothetical protein M1150_03370 [Patescibacteria group bacterium]|nr:hypothetical protein [Patescibacteria group bacterium]
MVEKSFRKKIEFYAWILFLTIFDSVAEALVSIFHYLASWTIRLGGKDFINVRLAYRLTALLCFSAGMALLSWD